MSVNAKRCAENFATANERAAALAAGDGGEQLTACLPRRMQPLAAKSTARSDLNHIVLSTEGMYDSYLYLASSGIRSDKALASIH